MSNEKKEKIEQINQDTPVLPQNINEAKDTPVDCRSPFRKIRTAKLFPSDPGRVALLWKGGRFFFARISYEACPHRKNAPG